MGLPENRLIPDDKNTEEISPMLDKSNDISGNDINTVEEESYEDPDHSNPEMMSDKFANIEKIIPESDKSDEDKTDTISSTSSDESTESDWEGRRKPKKFSDKKLP